MRSLLCLVASLLLAAPAAAQDMPLSQVLLPGEGWKLLGKRFKSASHLSADHAGNVYLATGEEVLRIDEEGKSHRFARIPAHHIRFGPDRRLYASLSGEDIVAVDRKGRKTVLVKGRVGHDMAFTPAGQLYYLGPPEDFRWTIYMHGRKEPAVRTPLLAAFPAAMVVWPDGGTLVVCAPAHQLYAYRIENDGTLTAREEYYSLRARWGGPSGADALVMDTAGRLYAATPQGVQVFDPTGRLCGVLAKPERADITALTFGGPDFDRLYVLCNNKLYVRKLKAKGVPPPAPKKK